MPQGRQGIADHFAQVGPFQSVGGQGSALVARLVPAEQVGGVTGLVGAAGGLGGFFPPLVMGAVYSTAHDYSWGFLLLAATAAASAAFTAITVRRSVH
ncbi:hypothetical protein [Streptomyces sp. N35]|uniref:hypothetical protein n=1 Tax=Streptomyces sp. N35 TaxID=2795730 RepID=UPI0027DAE9D5|nr:hypothetical protein [Streptomyces sp. N35]